MKNILRSIRPGPFCLPAFAVALCCTTAQAGAVLDFEDAADFGGDNAAVSDQYASSHGVTFSAIYGSTAETAVSGLPKYEQIGSYSGDPAKGFASSAGTDSARPEAAAQLGDFFMRGPADLGSTGYVKLTVDYTDTVDAASGELWDIDGGGASKSEQYVVTAYNANGDVLAQVTSPEGTSYKADESLDGLPWSWSLSAAEISKIEIETTGTKTRGNGLAFNNFNASEANANATTHAAPIPAALYAGLLGFGALSCSRKRRRALQLDDC